MTRRCIEHNRPHWWFAGCIIDSLTIDHQPSVNRNIPKYSEIAGVYEILQDIVHILPSGYVNAYYRCRSRIPDFLNPGNHNPHAHTSERMSNWNLVNSELCIAHYAQSLWYSYLRYGIIAEAHQSTAAGRKSTFTEQRRRSQYENNGNEHTLAHKKSAPWADGGCDF